MTHIHIDDDTVRVGDIEFEYGMVPPPADADDERLWVFKPRILVEAYVALLERVQPRRIVELGIHSGGSTALLAEMTRPERLVAIELSPTRLAPLDNYIERHSMHDVVRAHFGVDQGDRTRLDEIAAEEFGDEPIDLVIDDASHEYRPSLASFETLFPRVRPGGSYVIEDWSGHDQLVDRMMRSVADPDADGWAERAEKMAGDIRQRADTTSGPEADRARRLADEFLTTHSVETLVEAGRAVAAAAGTEALSRLALELTLMRAEAVGPVEQVVVTGGWVEIVRGEAELSVGDFDVARSTKDYFAALRD